MRNYRALLLLLWLCCWGACHGQQQQGEARPPRKPPNFIVMQPDDLITFEEWSPPAHFPTTSRSELAWLDEWYWLPNLQRLRSQGVEMTQAYTASPMCGTSRYSTLTGRYPSRSSFSRRRNLDEDISDVVIGKTKLYDVRRVADGYDCSENNLAAALSRNGYRTGVVGKWHLSAPPDNYDYTAYTDEIRSCGFDYVEGIYAENLQNFWHDGTFSHNMEFIADKAQDFLYSAANANQPFFLYFNPTAPHDSGDVYEALTEYSCRATPEGWLEHEPNVPGMTADYGSCEAYRQSILRRAAGSTDPTDLGALWIDDAVGALWQILENIGELDNTFFLFQTDHGKEGKGSLYEPGVRIAQFVHYPAAFGIQGWQWDGLVSTIDIAPTILDFAGIDHVSQGQYPMDGVSWKDAVQRRNETDSYWRSRCLVFELDYDRAVRCGCYKYMSMYGQQWSSTMRKSWWMGVAADAEVLFNLCDESGIKSVAAPGDSPETWDLKYSDESGMLRELRRAYNNHLRLTRPYNDPVIFE